MNIGNTKNNENIFTRAIIAGVLNLLNNGINYKQYHCNGSIDEIDIPWYYNMSGDERFMQDFFTDYKYCMHSNAPKQISGNFDAIPMGIITYNGSTIAQDALTSRFVKGNFYKDVNGNLESYTSYLFSIPLNLQFNCEVRIPNFTNALLVEEMIREVFYKTQTIYVLYKGMRIGAQVGFPESVAVDKNVNYSYEQDRNIVKITFDIEVETYQPCFDHTMEYPSKNVIKNIGVCVHTNNADIHKDNIFFTSNFKSLYANKFCLIEWNSNNENDIIGKVDLAYIYNNEEYVIDKFIPNHMMYKWEVPSLDRFKYNLVFSETFVEEPDIIISPKGKYITEESIKIINGGYYPMESSKITPIIEYINKTGEVSYIENISFNISEHTIDSVVHFDPFFLDINDTQNPKIKLKIYNSMNKDVFSISDDIEIL